MRVGPTPLAFEPGYLRLLRSGELGQRARQAWRRLEACDLCARYCRVNRFEGIGGAVCRTGARAVVHAAFPHHGEERCLSGWNGSGTIFFSWCNLRCLFCQNWEISWEGEGREVEAEELAELMLGLQRAGCHNVNLVSPSHVVAQVLAAVEMAARQGLTLPLVWNTGGYDSPEALQLLDGVVDLYMPDVKYGDSAVGRRLSKVPDYVEVNRAAVKAMHRQVGDLRVDEDGLARRGLLVRHLVLPGGLAGTEAAMRFLVEEVSPRTWVNLMDQYRACYRADEVPEVARRPTRAELRQALLAARRAGIQRLDPGSAAVEA
ncbi:MAG TPA: radical SAM protein [Anaeromyxobacteraceae bacterium]|nr:radical SAM protein [Anaeromyxobacteraceae bacterium]